MHAEIINQISVYDMVYGNSMILIDSIVEKNYILAYELYEIYDKLGFFESNWEQKLINQFEGISENLLEISSGISKINESIIEKFELISNKNIEDMSNKIKSPKNSNSIMPLLSLYGGYKLGYHMVGPAKNK
jgi:hypothetical protein